MGLCLSEDHSKKLELQLCDFVLQEMKNEGSTHFRPECVSEAADAGSASENKNRPGSGGEPPLKKQKKTKEKKNNEGEDDEAEEPQEPKTKKTKKEKKNKGDEEEEESKESLPW